MATIIIDCAACFGISPPPPPPPTFSLSPCCPDLFAPPILFARMILEETFQGHCSCFAQQNLVLQRVDSCDPRGVWASPLCATGDTCGIPNSQFWVNCDPNGPSFSFFWKCFDTPVPPSGTPLTICSCDPLFIWFPRVAIPFYDTQNNLDKTCSGVFSVCVNTTGDFTNCFNCHCCLEALGTYPAAVPLHVTIQNASSGCNCLAGTYELLPAAPSVWLSQPILLCGLPLVFGVSCNQQAVNGWIFSIYEIGNPAPLAQTPMTLHGCLPFGLELTSLVIPGPVPCAGSFVVGVNL